MSDVVSILGLRVRIGQKIRVTTRGRGAFIVEGYIVDATPSLLVLRTRKSVIAVRIPDIRILEVVADGAQEEPQYGEAGGTPRGDRRGGANAG